MTDTSRQILYITQCDPWDQWCTSGFVMTLCRQLKEKKLLLGAISSKWPCERHLLGPGMLGGLERRLRRTLRRKQQAAQWRDEREGAIAGLLRRLPPQTAVIYQYHLPEFDRDLPIARFLFQDITVRDAARTGGYGHDNMSKAVIERKCAAQREAIEQVDGVLTFSSYAAESISREYGYPRDRVTAVGAGPIRTIGIRPGTTVERYAAARILFVGRKWEPKGGPLLLDAFRKVRRVIPHATLTIVGPSVAPSTEDGIQFIGLTSNRRVLRLFSECSVFCMPSICETWGVVYTEAAHAGMPIVGFKAWAMPDVVDNGRTGRLTSGQTVEDLAGALIEVLQNPERMRAMGLAARQRVGEVLDWPHVVDRLLSRVLPEALNGRQARPLRTSAGA